MSKNQRELFQKYLSRFYLLSGVNYTFFNFFPSINSIQFFLIIFSYLFLFLRFASQIFTQHAPKCHFKIHDHNTSWITEKDYIYQNDHYINKDSKSSRFSIVFLEEIRQTSYSNYKNYHWRYGLKIKVSGFIGPFFQTQE